MASGAPPRTVADALVERLRSHRVQHIFGYPGGQLTPLYDALARQSAIRHVLARDEQAAGFMADGYARATGKPGVCLAVCGPGVLNAATPLATAFTDSVPVLLISGQVPAAGRGLRSGYYHENDQQATCATLAKASLRVEGPAALLPQLDTGMTLLTSGRPGPVFIEIPVDVFRSPHGDVSSPTMLMPTLPPAPLAPEIAELARLLQSWRRPLLLAGGGAVTSGAASLLVQLAERLGAPVFHSLNGKTALPTEHALAAGLPWNRATSDLTNMGPFMSPLFAQADGLLAVGCRFSQACTGSWELRPPPALAQIDIDPAELGRHYPVTLGIAADAKASLRLLLDALPPAPRTPWTVLPPREPAHLAGVHWLRAIRQALPRDAILVGDITRLTYQMLADFPTFEPRTFLHPAGYVSMGFGLPAALGAKAAFPERTVVTVVGDGCFLMSGMELATAVQEQLPVIVVVVNDGALSLIKSIQERRYENRFLAVDLKNPDFALFARAFGVGYWRVDDEQSCEAALRAAAASKQAALVEIRLASERPTPA